ncbi:MAG: DUF1993 domain-containing protein [Pseudomonadota bacterium]
MTTDLYKSTVGAMLRQTEALRGVVAKGREHLGADADAFITEGLCEDMLPFTFQIRSMNHHSVNMLKSLEAGEAGPPPAMEITDYAGCEQLLDTTIESLKTVTPEQLDNLVKNDVIFAIGDVKMPFTGLGFLTSFSLPNFYFHATTAYNLLRQKGVPVGKRDYLGAVELNLA